MVLNGETYAFEVRNLCFCRRLARACDVTLRVRAIKAHALFLFLFLYIRTHTYLSAQVSIAF